VAGAAQIGVTRQGRVVSLVIDNPEQRNALRPEFSQALARELRLASDDDSIGAVVLSGAGAHFCAGGDLRTLHQTRRSEPKQHHYDRITRLNELVRAARQCAKPVIAAVEGHAAGAGFSIALACDLIVAAEDAQFTLSYVKVGLNPDGNGSFALARALPPQLAAEIAMTGTPVAAARLAQLGVVNRLAPKGKALAEALDWAAQLAGGATRAIGRIKRLLDEAHTNDYSRHLELERALFVEALHGDEAGEGIGAFLEKRPPKFHQE
jgi:enoyl-CoA hydratase/carnithine racemase